MIRWVLFDFGGVIAEEGFREGLKAIAADNGLDGDLFVSIAGELMYKTGYVLGEVVDGSVRALRKALDCDVNGPGWVRAD